LREKLKKNDRSFFGIVDIKKPDTAKKLSQQGRVSEGVIRKARGGHNP
jgi:hypothetical protein